MRHDVAADDLAQRALDADAGIEAVFARLERAGLFRPTRLQFHHPGFAHHACLGELMGDGFEAGPRRNDDGHGCRKRAGLCDFAEEPLVGAEGHAGSQSDENDEGQEEAHRRATRSGYSTGPITRDALVPPKPKEFDMA